MQPNLLVIGAMKAGTTSLVAALEHHPEIFFPASKEPDVLTTPGASPARIREIYDDVLRAADSQTRIGDASTSSTKRHLHPDAAERAAAALGPDVRLVFVHRDPVARMVSHANHLRRGGQEPLASVLGPDDPIVATSRYAWQLEPWIEVFGREALHLIDFVELTDRPAEVLTGVQEHLGLEPLPLELPHQNAGSSSRLEGPFRWLVADSRLYRSGLREHIPGSVRQFARRRLSSRKPVRLYRTEDLRLSAEAEALLADDQRRFADLRRR